MARIRNGNSVGRDYLDFDFLSGGLRDITGSDLDFITQVGKRFLVIERKERKMGNGQLSNGQEAMLRELAKIPQIDVWVIEDEDGIPMRASYFNEDGLTRELARTTNGIKRAFHKWLTKADEERKVDA